MEHRFNVQFAKDYGIEEAILIENLYFWIAKNVANGKHKYERRYWTYNSAKAFAELFPYINETKIYRVLAHLEDVEFIIKGKFSQDKHDRTNWYSFSDKGLSRLNAEKYDTINFSETFQNDDMDFTKMQNGTCKNANCIIINNTDSKQQIENKEEDIIISSKKAKKSNEPIVIAPEMQEVVDTWLQYKKEKGQSYKPTGFNSFYKKLCKLSNNNPQVAMAIVEESMSNNYAGLFPLKQQNTLFDNLPTGMIIRETQSERNEKFKNEKGWG